MDDLFQKAQGAIATRLNALGAFQFTPAFINRPRKYFVDTLAPDGVTTIPAGTVIDTPAIHSQIEQALGGLTFKGGKCGTAIVVFNPKLDDRDPLSNKPAERFVFTIRIIENNLVNCGPTGTGLSAEALAHTAKHQLSGWAPCAGMRLLPMESGCIAPVVISSQKKNEVVYELRMYSNIIGKADDRVARPALTYVRDEQNPGNWVGDFSIKCDTPGANIYYTTDGSFPIASNSAAILFQPEMAPIPVAAGTTISCAAYKDGLTFSDVVEILFQ